MGTRSLTLIANDQNKKSIMVNMYRQMDGYPSGQGNDLAQFLKTFKMVNGLSLADEACVDCGKGTHDYFIVLQMRSRANPQRSCS